MTVRSLLLTVAAAALVACAGASEDAGPTADAGRWGEDVGPGRDGGPSPTDAGDDGTGSADTTDGDTTRDDGGAGADTGAATDLWLAECASCHGAVGEGGIGPSLIGWTAPRADLVTAIAETMPPADPTTCVDGCAETLADYILAWSDDDWTEPDCSEGVTPGPRAIRLLTRREYDNTIRDLFSATATTCETIADCDTRSQRCEAGVCAANPCGEFTFTFDPGARAPSSVHVAGTFNGWAGTVEDGGWPMTWDARAGLWVARRDIGAGRHVYKFVVDGSDWIHDVRNPASEDDGFGGQNSVLDLSCDDGFDRDWSVDLPAESRPQHYAFETHAEASHGTPAHVEGWLEAAEDIAALAVRDLDALLPCDPGAGEVCARQFVRAFGQRAWRRPLTDDEVTRYAAYITSGATFDAGVERALTQLLVSPWFLYRYELGEPTGDGTWRLTSWELASLLSYAIIGTMPDAELFDAAASGALDTPAGLEAQARRLLADPRARESVAIFAEQWLGIEPVTTTARAAEWDAVFTPAVRAAMREETRRLVTHVTFDASGRFDELFAADYTFANEALADVYALDGVTGDALQWVALDDRRSGLLGHGAILATTAHSDQTSPIRRGLFVRQRILCQDFPTPPGDAGGVPDVDPDATTRERFAQHSSDPSCNSCHQYIDPVGFGFEHFDPIGAWRAMDGAHPIDAHGDLNDVEGFGTGTSAPFTTLPELAEILTASDAARRCFSRQYRRFVRGAIETRDDRCALAAIDEAFVDADLDILEMMVAVTLDPSFALRR